MKRLRQGRKLTEKTVAALASTNPKGDRYWDRELRGFAVVVLPKKTFFGVRYRRGRFRRWLTIGDHGVLTCEEARERARDILAAVQLGGDPALERERARGMLVFEEWREQYVKDAAGRLKSTRDPERYLKMAGEAWDRRPLDEITARDVETLRNRIAERGATQANRFLANLRASFTHAVRLGHVESNPAEFVPLLKANEPRVRVLSPEEETRLRAAVAAHHDPFVRAAFTLLLDVGARRSEVLRARREDFNLDEGTWTIRSAKSGRARSCPILPPVVAVLRATPRIGPFLLPGRKARPALRRMGTTPGDAEVFTHRVDLKGPWAELKEAAKLGDDVTIHDLRRSAGLRFTKAVGIFGASKLLGHTSSAVTEKVYAPISSEDLRGFAKKAARKVVKFPTKAAR